MKNKKSASAGGFTLGMALTDFLPVLFFGVSGAAAFSRLRSPLFGLGALLAVQAGCCKAGWKLAAAVRRKEIPLLTRLFHLLMPCGFALMLLSVPISLPEWSSLARDLLTMPSLGFAAAGCAGMAVMAVFAVRLDGRSIRAN